jgi:2-hydroxycyclohexanecarboxyl-CoA dehydrogenase
VSRALVTGAGSGIGAAVAARLSAEGAEVVLADVNEEAVAAQADVLGQQALVLDVTDRERVARELPVLGPFTILVNNAGMDDFGFFTEVAPERWRAVLAVNLEGVMACSQAVLPGMQQAGYGRIVNVASEAGRIGAKGNAAYAAAKGGVIAFTKSLAREQARYAITANAVAPGPIDTPLLRAMDAHAIEVITNQTQLGRLGTPEEVAAAVCFLASEDAGYITGETIGVSGGMALGG